MTKLLSFPALFFKLCAANVPYLPPTLTYDTSIAYSKASTTPVPSSASSFNFQISLVSLRSPRSSLCLLHRLPITFILHFMFPSATCCTGQFPRTLWPIELAFLLFYCVYDILLLLDSMQHFFILQTIGPTDVHPSPTPRLKISRYLLFTFRNVQGPARY